MSALSTDHVAIVGMSFSGSSVLSFVLGGLPGCATIGESHWIRALAPEGHLLQCGRCGYACPVINADLRRRLGTSEAWYPTLRRALDCDVLISSDKQPALLAELDPDGERMDLVLFRPPRHALASWRSHVSPAASLDEQESYLDYWQEFYAGVLESPEPKQGRILVDWTAFVAGPERSLLRVSQAIGVHGTVSALRYWMRRHHFIGGNFNPYWRASGGAVMELSDAKERPTEEMPETLHDHPSHALYQQLASTSITEVDHS